VKEAVDDVVSKKGNTKLEYTGSEGDRGEAVKEAVGKRSGNAERIAEEMTVRVLLALALCSSAGSAGRRRQGRRFARPMRRRFRPCRGAGARVPQAPEEVDRLLSARRRHPAAQGAIFTARRGRSSSEGSSSWRRGARRPNIRRTNPRG